MTVEEDFSAFLAEVADVKQLKSDDKVFLKRQDGNELARRLRRDAIKSEQRRSNNYLTLADIDPIALNDPIQFKLEGVQDLVYKNLRLGKYAIESTLNMQSMTLDVAHKEVFEFITQSHLRGLRCVLMRHGLNENRKPFPGYLKSYLNVWLQQIPEVLAFHSSQLQHGGLKSTYVLLKKNKQQKADNRERHKLR
ncbi:DNA endonuclease SmrA [Planctobacterium marinum]|uniref:DNA endonuclease SmrA n=1 Tax=Planctobacterium marinum TaxID=1631968 RepID=UPI001E3A3D01|nr:DNA endonuclease SmrA [Planctobacterium marinum]MCC2606294.1 DNA endonuclease SmrA [Planctobacterium marinum]